MVDVLAHVMAIAITIPLFITVLVYFTSKRLVERHWRAIHIAVDSTTIFYILAVNAMIYSLFQYHVTGYMILFLAFMFTIFVFAQWKQGKDIIFSVIWKYFWKSSFLLFFILYIGFSLYGVCLFIYRAV
ncbi:hypothetical protein J416_01329 [Gracilibacillus halophilus YIM-C55.5]|uniref:DUF3397 domain-containing protein n=1 Tax=Gracilibacillus halophilus YIM-C55.5 TaxID=1308866 RepID=N4WGF0_9BACI|nr:DUF3397 domain-containing protein [Gracilibacillus halophilus]ENH98339.1 hypothetical protein J416_01329 [Gracilibacillus halophilus YIM-C55.5]